MLLELEIEHEPMLLFVLVHHEPEVIGSAFELIRLNHAFELLCFRVIVDRLLLFGSG